MPTGSSSSIVTRPAALAAACLALLLSAAAAEAEAAPALALTDDGRLFVFDTDTRRVEGGPVPVRGVEGRVLGVDVRPSDGAVYAVSDAPALYRLDPGSGEATEVAALSAPLPAGARAVVDFNPVADRLRLMAEDGTNLRVNPADGQATVDGRLRYDAGEEGAGRPPAIVAGAYTNSVAGAKETALYTVDLASGRLNLQAPPNDGVQKARGGGLGLELETTPAFDIAAEGGANRAYLLNRGVLHEVDLEGGSARRLGRVGGLRGDVIDLAILPAR
jgi:Domain of unknown function (DUF4394)